MKDLLISITKGLVENPDAISVDVSEPDEEGVIVYHLHVSEDDMGRVIGKQGRIAKAIRVVMRAAATRNRLIIVIKKSSNIELFFCTCYIYSFAKIEFIRFSYTSPGCV